MEDIQQYYLKKRYTNELNGITNFMKCYPDDQYEAAMKAECIPMNREAIMNEYMPIRSEFLTAEKEGDTETVERLRPEYERLRNILSRNMTLFNQARAQAKKDREKCCVNQEDFVIDGTGGNLSEIKKQVKDAKKVDYDVAMIYVYVPLKESQKRNRGRPRRLTPLTVERSWNAVDRNRVEYEGIFKSNFFLVVNTEEESEASINSIRHGLASFLES